MGTHSMGSSTKNKTKGRAPGNSKPIWNYKTKDLRPPPAGCLLVTPTILGLDTKVKVNTRPRAAVGPSTQRQNQSQDPGEGARLFSDSFSSDINVDAELARLRADC